MSFRVVGVLGPKGANMMGFDQDDILLAPWTTIKFRLGGTTMSNATAATQPSASGSAAATSSLTSVNTLSNLYPNSTTLYSTPTTSEQADTPQPCRFVNVDQILCKAASLEDIPGAIKQITDLLRERHRIRPQPNGEFIDDFNIRDMTEITRRMEEQANMMTMLLIAVALISLIVGGVGIMNIMLVSVTERTREIGLRMAVGAGPAYPAAISYGGGGAVPVGRGRGDRHGPAGFVARSPLRPLSHRRS